MQFKYLGDKIDLLEKFVARYEGEVIPCTREEVNKLESMLPNSYRLPIAYKEFLLYGGKEIGQFYEEGSRFDYKRALNYVKSGRNSAISILEQYEADPHLSNDIYVLTTYMSSFFNFFKLTEGENPPVYEWLEEDEIGTEAIVKAYDSFTDFIRDEIRTRHLLLRPSVRRDEISLNKLPRGQQYWIAGKNEETEGILIKNLADYFGVAPLWKLEKITEILNISPIEYLEELSGWKAHKIGDEVRFYPPSYLTPEEKEKKALELQNQIEVT